MNLAGFGFGSTISQYTKTGIRFQEESTGTAQED
jgi:hypothetical protein